MAKKPAKPISASEFVMKTACEFPEQEMQVADLFAWCEGRYTKENLLNAATRLLQQGKLVKATEPNRATWYAVDHAWYAANRGTFA
jgi:hypothetical protein